MKTGLFLIPNKISGIIFDPHCLYEFITTFAKGSKIIQNSDFKKTAYLIKF